MGHLGKIMPAQIHAPNAQERACAVALAATARNLRFLDLIDATIDAVSANTKHARICVEDMRQYFEQLQRAFAGMAVPHEDRFVEKLDKIMNAARRVHREAAKRRDAASRDQMLRPDDGVAEAHAGLMAIMEDLFNCAAECKDWIETNNALLEPVSGKAHKSVDDLFAAMGL